MKLVLISLLWSVSLAKQTYEDLTKVDGIEIKTYGTQAAKDIRAIGRSYVYHLTKRLAFTVYAQDVYNMFSSDSTNQVFSAFDTKTNLSISSSEFQSAYKKYKIRDLTEDEAKQLIVYYDGDDSDTVDFAEFSDKLKTSSDWLAIKDSDIIIDEGNEAEKAKVYSQRYMVHVGVVGVGIILAIFLFIGFCCSPLCMCCCNKSQRQTSTMSMWRMIWGTVLIVLLAANVAGILILVVSGDQMLKLEGETTDTIDTLADGVVDYLDGTDKQIETLKTKQLVQFVGALTPLVENAVDSAVSTIKDDAVLSGHVTDLTTALGALNSELGKATNKIGVVKTHVDALTTTINAINANLAICKKTFEDCDAAESNACSTGAGVTADKFENSFNPDILDASDIDTVINKIGEMKTFGGKTLSEWKTFVEGEWNGIGDRATTATAQAVIDYKKQITEAQNDFTTKMEKQAQKQIKSLRDLVTDNKEKTKNIISGTLKYIKNLMLLKEVVADEDVPKVITDFGGNAIGKYAIFAVFVFICVLLGLLVLTVIIGLLSTIFGCCKVNDEVLPTERSSGTCGCLLMCTSYCSVILCAIATLVAAILITVVMAQEGTCKQYSDKTLFDGLKSMSSTFNVKELDLGKQITERLKMEDKTYNLKTLLDNCKNNYTLFAALEIKEDTVIFESFSVTTIKEEIDTEINKFKESEPLKNININLDLMDATSREDLKKNKDSLNGYDYTDIITKLENTGTTQLTDLGTLSTEVGKLITNVGNKYKLQECKDGIDAIITDSGTVDTEKGDLETSLDEMSTIANDAAEEVDKFIKAYEGINDIIAPTDADKADTDKATNEYIKGVVEPVVEAVINTALEEVTGFMDYIFDQFQNSIGNCQPLAAVYYTAFNYTCDNIFVHVTLLYCALSLIGIALLFYMCVARCMARYFIKYSHLHPGDEGCDNQWAKDNSMIPIHGAGNRVGPYPGHYAQTKL